MGDRTCTIEGCQEMRRARGLCPWHYRRWWNVNRHLTASVEDQSGERNYGWVGDQVSYMAMHDRIRKARGPADCYDCLSCGQGAAEWAYDHRDPAAREQALGSKRKVVVGYSVRMWHYIPLCRKCHVNFDHSGR